MPPPVSREFANEIRQYESPDPHTKSIELSSFDNSTTKRGASYSDNEETYEYEEPCCDTDNISCDNMGEEQFYCGAGVCCIGMLLMLILLPMSFRSLSEEQLAFKKHGISNKVDFDKLYEPGHYHTGPSHKFEPINRHIHTVVLNQQAAWTCPEAEDGQSCLSSNDSANANVVGQTIYTSFSVNYRVTRTKEAVKLAYDKYQFNDGSVESAVKSLSSENAKETPQSYTLRQIIDAYTDVNPQICVDVPLLNSQVAEFGYQVEDIIVTEIALDDSAQAKYLLTETNQYLATIVEFEQQATEVRQETEALVYGINNLALSEVYAIEAWGNTEVARLDADLEAYRRAVDVNGTELLIEMYKRNFPSATEMEIAELTATTQYIDQVLAVGSHSGVETLFIDSQTNRLLTQDA